MFIKHAIISVVILFLMGFSDNSLDYESHINEVRSYTSKQIENFISLKCLIPKNNKITLSFYNDTTGINHRNASHIPIETMKGIPDKVGKILINKNAPEALAKLAEILSGYYGNKKIEHFRNYLKKSDIIIVSKYYHVKENIAVKFTVYSGEISPDNDDICGRETLFILHPEEWRILEIIQNKYFKVFYSILLLVLVTILSTILRKEVFFYIEQFFSAIINSIHKLTTNILNFLSDLLKGIGNFILGLLTFVAVAAVFSAIIFAIFWALIWTFKSTGKTEKVSRLGKKTITRKYESTPIKVDGNWQVNVEGLDKNKLKANFKFLVLSEDYEWEHGGHLRISFQGKTVEFTKLEKSLRKFVQYGKSSIDFFIVIGTASQDGDQDQSNRLARKRAKILAKWIKKNRLYRGKIKEISLGQHIDSCGKACPSKILRKQRPIIIVSVRGKDKKVDVLQALANAMQKELSGDYSLPNTADYREFIWLNEPKQDKP